MVTSGMAKSSKDLEDTKLLMGALVRMKPKPHEELKKKKAEPSNDSASKPKRKKQAAK